MHTMNDSELQDAMLSGSEREAALEECRKQIAAWGLNMPDVEPLPLHFGLNDFRNTGEIEFWIANETDAGYCGKFIFVFDGQTCPYHHHNVKHETFFIVKGRMKMIINGQERIMEQGDTLAVPTGTDHSFTGLGNALLLEVSMPSTTRDSFFADKRIGKDGVI